MHFFLTHDSGPRRDYRDVISLFLARHPECTVRRPLPPHTCIRYVVALPQYLSSLPLLRPLPSLPLLHTPSQKHLLPTRRMSYRPSAPRSIPRHRRTHRRSPSPPARRAYSRFSRDGSDSGHSQGWSSPRPRSSASRSSGGHSSDLIFPMDSERGSNSNSSRQGSVEPDFLYETPRGDQTAWDPRAMPVCSRCGRQFYGHVPLAAHNRVAAICPVCSLHESRERAQRRAAEDDFYATAGYHLHRGRPAERHFPSHVPQPADDQRNRRQRANSTAIHVIGRAFPSFGAPLPSRQASQPYPPSAWTNPEPLPHFTPVCSSVLRLLAIYPALAPPIPTECPRPAAIPITAGSDHACFCYAVSSSLFSVCAFPRTLSLRCPVSLCLVYRWQLLHYVYQSWSVYIVRIRLSQNDMYEYNA
ncbi:hypothetical protein C8T65DRAFT_92784 [Cerioporus squamosus]|nr:hypothetical protein C8T65DRAFT_92784 [Cerioporus squamosus]